MIDLSHNLESAPTHSGYEGKWHAIELQPELAVPQRFVIGVALSTKGKLTHFRVAEDAPKLKCFYGQRFGVEVWNWLRNELLNDLQQAKGSSFARYISASPQVLVGEGNFASGSSADSTLSRAFERVVTVVNGERKPRVQGVAQAALREQVAGILKGIMRNRYETISQPEAGMLIAEKGTVHTFDIGYDDNCTASSVVSACYASLDTARLNLLTATTDLQTFLKIRQRQQIGLAVLTPSAQTLPKEAVQLWQDWWSHYSYKLRQSDTILLAEATTAEHLADQVLDWYPEAEN